MVYSTWRYGFDFILLSKQSLVDYFHWTYFSSHVYESFQNFPPKVCISREHFLSFYSLLFMRCIILLNKGHQIIFCSLSFACTRTSLRETFVAKDTSHIRHLWRYIPWTGGGGISHQPYSNWMKTVRMLVVHEVEIESLVGFLSYRKNYEY